MAGAEGERARGYDVNVYDHDGHVVGQASAWLVRYAEMAEASAWLVVSYDVPGGMQRCLLERCMVHHATFGPEGRKDHEVRALRLKDAASVEVFKAILEDEAKRGLHPIQDA